MEKNKDYAYYDLGLMMTSKSPMSRFDVCLVSTKDYVFFVPVKSVGFFVILNTIKTHKLFEGVSVQEGVQKLIAQQESVESLEKAMCALLEDNDKYIYHIPELKSFKFRGFFGKHTVRMSRGGANWATVMPYKKADSKEFRAFHNQ